MPVAKDAMPMAQGTEAVFPASILSFALCAALGLAAYFAHVFDGLDRQALDGGFALRRAHFPKPAPDDVVIVAIDEAFLSDAREPVALLHTHLADLFDAVAAGQPKVTGLDVVLPDRSFSFLVPLDKPDTDFDAALTRGLLKLSAAAPLIIGEIWDHPHGRFREIFTPFLAAAGQWTIARGQRFDARGSALFCPDRDGVVREYPGALCQPGGARRTLTERVAALADRTHDWSGFIDYGTGSAFGYIAGRDLIAWHKAGDHARLAPLRDKVVLVGTVLDNDDRLRAPVPLLSREPGNHLVPGIAIHAQVLRSMLNSGFVQPVPAAWVTLLILLAAGLALFRRVVIAGAMYAFGMVLLVGAALALLHANLFLPVLVVIATATLALALVWGVAARRHLAERNHLTRTFNGYVSPQVLEGILSGALSPARKGVKRRVCVLFSDIRDFTTMSEGLAPDKVVELLNDYFDRMARIVHAHGGTVDKFIGDGMMAIFGNPQALDTPERNALEAARDMLIALTDLNRDFQSRGLPPVRIGIGLHSGEAVIGHLGSHERHEYTAIGDAVNVAARVCDLPKKLGKPIACTEPVAKAVGYPAYLIDAGEQAIKGHTEVRVYGWDPEMPDNPQAARPANGAFAHSTEH